MAEDIEALRRKLALKRRLEELESGDPSGIGVPDKNEPSGKGLATLGKYGLKALDYASGLSRSAINYMVDPDQEYANKDLLKALYGESPGLSQRMAEAGINPGPSLSQAVPGLYSDTGKEWLKFQKGGALDPTVRGFAGFVGDAATDPLTYFSLGSAPALKESIKTVQKVRTADAIANPVTAALNWAGKKTYKSGLKRIDQEVAKFGKDPVSDVLMQEGVRGGERSIYNQMEQLGDKYSAQAKQIVNEAHNEARAKAFRETGELTANSGDKVSMQQAMEPVQARINKIRASKDPKLQGVADALQKEVDDYLKLDYSPARTDVSFTKPELVEGSLPIKSRYLPGTPDQVVTDWTLGNLPVKSSYAPQSRPSRVSEYMTGSLPIGDQTVILENPALGYYNMKNPTMTIEGGARTVPGMPEHYIPKAPEMTIEEVKKVIPGQPDAYVPQMAEPYMYNQPSKPVIGNYFPEVPGVNVKQAQGYKQSVYGGIPKGQWMEMMSGKHPEYIGGQKDMARGLKEGVENFVESQTGRGAELAEVNDKLGRVLTSGDKQLLEAMKAENKNMISSVDAPLMYFDPKAGLLKKAADLAKQAGVRTRLGYYMTKSAEKGAGIWDTLARRDLIELLKQNQYPNYVERNP